MRIPESLTILIQQLNQELDRTEQKAYQGINLVRPLLALFSENLMLIRHFAYFNNVILFVDITRNKVRSILEDLSTDDVTEETIQEMGEDLGNLLGQVIEAKIAIESIILNLELF